MRVSKMVVIFGLVVGAILFSGCGAKPLVEYSEKRTDSVYVKNAEHRMGHVTIRNGTGSPSWGANEKGATLNLLESVARATKELGNNYFAFASSAVANTKGSLINTPKEFIDKCVPSSAHVISVFNGNISGCNIAKNTKAVASFVMFPGQYDAFTTYNADEVIEYMKANGYYEGFEYEMKPLK